MTKLLNLIVLPMGKILSFLYSFIGNYGVTLILLTLIVKLVTFPLYKSQMLNTLKMAELQPKMKDIQARFGHDKALLGAKMQELYKEEKYNPAGGCLPMLIQMPIIFGLFSLLRDPLSYISDQQLIFAVHEPFLWIADLSHPDKWILPILAGVATFISFSLSQQAQMGTGQANPASGMKVMKYIFPVAIVLIGRSFPAGLAIYWFFGQFIQIFISIHLNSVRKKMNQQKEKSKRMEKAAVN